MLVVPEWKSAGFWPSVSGQDGHFCTFVKDILVLPSGKKFYVP